MSERRFLLLAVVGFALVSLVATSAWAGLSRKVMRAFQGDILITTDGLPAAGDSDPQTIAAFKKARAKTLESTESDGVASWTFHYTAFLKKKPGVDTLSFDFYTNDKEKLYVANKRIMGVDPGLTVLEGRLSITEDDNLNRGRSYIVKLTGQVRGKEVVFATTTVNTK